MEHSELRGCLVNLYDGSRIRMDCSSGFSIGRIPIQNNKGLHLEDGIISREHACITFEENHFYIVDLNSKNGSKVNGTALEPYKKYKLSQYCLIEFSKIKYRFEYDQNSEKVDLGYGTFQAMEINGQKKGCIELSTKVEIIKYQKEMIEHNPYHCLLKMNVLSSDKNSRIYYNLSNMTALAAIIQERKMSKKDFIDLSFSIFEVVKQTERLLLFPECLVLHPELIYYDENQQPYFIYLPIRREEDFLIQIKSLLMELAGKYLDKSERSFRKLILTALSTKNVTLDDIRSMMMDAQEIKVLDTSDNISSEKPKEMEREEISSIKKFIICNKYFVILQGVVLLLLICLMIVKGFEINQKIGSGIMVTALDAWVINSWMKKKEKVNNEGASTESEV